MTLERARQIEIAVSLAAVGLFVGVLVVIGMRYNQGGLGGDGGLVLVAAITAFVLLMAGVGYVLAFYLPRESD